MFIDKNFAHRLDSTCNTSKLQPPLQRFLNVWAPARSTQEDCRAALKVLCHELDQNGRWHESEAVCKAGLELLEQEERRQRTDRAIILSFGGIVGAWGAVAIIRSFFCGSSKSA